MGGPELAVHNTCLARLLRNNDGQLKTTVSKGLPGTETTESLYDTNGRLTKNGSTTYEYDPANNPTKLGANTYKYDVASQLETGPSLTYTYDTLGERTKTAPSTGPATTYGYDETGNLTSATRVKEGEIKAIEDTYAYNGESLRTSETISAATNYLVWDITETLPLLLNDGTNSYIYGPGRLPIEQISSGGTVSYLHHDQQGSTRLLTGSSGTSEATVTYDAYGNKTGSTGTATTPLAYDSQYTNTDTGLLYLRARSYDPATAQFLTVDPAEPVTRAPYNYTEDSPLSAGDPSGLCNNEPWSMGFWTEGNCLSGAVGGPNGGGSQPTWWDIPAYGAVAIPCLFGGEAVCTGAAATSVVGSLAGPGTVCSGATTFPDFNDTTKPPGPGWEWRGGGPVGSKQGTWFNPTTRQKIHPDLDHPPGKEPHYGYKGPNDGEKSDLFPGDPIPEIPEVP